jgi:NlpC/P60 family
MGNSNKDRKWRVVVHMTLAVCLTGGCMMGNPLASAQVPSAAQGPVANSRLLSAQEGRAIVDAARDQDQPGRSAQDCSHLVHQTYVDAGFEYPYASSFELYAGGENFERVRHPQPGDLIVWPGHVGIVLEPLEHTFYSLVSTGLEAQNYEGPYWRSRGRPRFYRYKVETAEILTATVKAPAISRPSNSTKQQDTEAVTEEGSPMAAYDPNRPPKMASERTRVMKDPPVLPAPVGERTPFEIPQSIVIEAGNKRPTNSQVAEGISELSNASGTILRTDGAAKLTMPVVIFDRLHVEHLDVKKDHGWARLQMDSRATITRGETEYKRRHIKVRWELRKTESGWEAIAPTDRMYVPNDVAVRNLAARLAQLTESDGAEARQESVLREESKLANLLSALLETSKPHATLSKAPQSN